MDNAAGCGVKGVRAGRGWDELAHRKAGGRSVLVFDDGSVYGVS